MLKKMSGGAYPITPSNASPVALTAGEMYDVMASGYAIASYTDVTPTDLPETRVYEGDIVRIVDNDGTIVHGIEAVIPSDTNPQQLSILYNYRVSGANAGYLVESYPTAVTPSSNPQSISGSGLYRFTGSCKVVSNILTLPIQPSDTSFITFPQNAIIRNQFNSACICALNTKIGRTGTIPDTEGNAVTVTVDTGLDTVYSFVLLCLGHKTSKYHTVVSWDVNDSSNYVGQSTYGEGTSGISGVWVKKALNNAIVAWIPTLVSVSGGIVTLKTGAHALAAIKDGLWIACSYPGG